MEMELYGMLYEGRHVSSPVQSSRDSGIGNNGVLSNNGCLETEQGNGKRAQKLNNENRCLFGEIFFCNIAMLNSSTCL